MIAVADAGPLMALAKIGGLDLLFRLYSAVFTTPAVYAEVVEAGLRLGAPDASVLQSAYDSGRLVVRSPALVAPASLKHLGSGEQESIRLALELRADALLIDDLDARHAAEVEIRGAGVSTTLRGTLGTIVASARAQIISREQATALVKVIQGRPDIWISADLCVRVIHLLARFP